MSEATPLSEIVCRLQRAFPEVPDQNTFYQQAEVELRQYLADHHPEVKVLTV